MFQDIKIVLEFNTEDPYKNISVSFTDIKKNQTSHFDMNEGSPNPEYITIMDFYRELTEVETRIFISESIDSIFKLEFLERS